MTPAACWWVNWELRDTVEVRSWYGRRGFFLVPTE